MSGVITMAKKNADKKKCVKCSKEQPIINFYASNSSMFSDKRVPICKACLKIVVNPKDLNSVKTVLRQVDKPFLIDVWNKAIESPKDTFGDYMRMISSLPQYKALTYEDSITESAHGAPVRMLDDNLFNEYEDMIEQEFDVTKEIVFKWGTGYKPKEYMRLEDLYTRMIESHDISAPQHKELLKLMCKMNFKMEIFLERDDINGFSKLHAEYQKLLASSGFRPIDRKSGDEVTGMRTFSQIFEEVEREGFIPAWDLDVEQDIVDRSLMYLINYQKKLLHQELLIKAPDDTPKIDGGEDE